MDCNTPWPWPLVLYPCVAWRPIVMGANPQEAIERGLQRGRLTLSRSHHGAIQEPGTVPRRLTFGADAPEGAIAGNSADCREGLARGGDEMGLTHVTYPFHNLPEDLAARLVSLEGFGAEVTQKLAG